MNEEAKYRQAKKRVNAKRSIIIHLSIYVPVIAFLFMLNWIVSPGFWWAFIAMGGWGVALVIHFIAVYGVFGIGSKKWQQAQIQKEMQRMEDDGLELDDRWRTKEKVLKDKDWDEGEFV